MMIIAVEGMDGAGKTTICEYIEKKYNFINVEKPTKYLFEDQTGVIDYDKYYETLDMIYQTDEATRTRFFGNGNIIAVTKFPNQDIVLDRHLASNYYWNGNLELHYYYQKLIENYGFEKEVDWTERKLYAPKEIDPRLEKISNMMLKKYKLHFGETKNTNEFLKKYADKFFDIIDETYTNIYGTVPFTPGMRKMMINNFKLIVDVKHVAVIVDENDNVVCFGICFPSIASAVKKSNGHLTPLGIMRILKAIKHPKVLDLGLIGVLPEYQMRGIATAIISKVMNMLSSGDIEYAETNLNLETNNNIQNQWKSFDSILHKRRRAFVKKIS